jgi:hypothetical protein
VRNVDGFFIPIVTLPGLADGALLSNLSWLGSACSDRVPAFFVAELVGVDCAGLVGVAFGELVGVAFSPPPPPQPEIASAVAVSTAMIGRSARGHVCMVSSLAVTVIP